MRGLRCLPWLWLALATASGPAQAEPGPPGPPEETTDPAPAAVAPSGPTPPSYPLPPASTSTAARLQGRVFARGSSTPIVGATVEIARSTAPGSAPPEEMPEPTLTGADGRFQLDLPAGSLRVTVTAVGFEPLAVVETLAPGTARTVEYRVVPLAGAARRRYGATVRGETRREGERFTLRDEELLQAPGALGDPFRVIATLPGVIAPIPLLPIYIVRGGSPGMNGFYLDGMRVPELFHLVLVDGVVHPRMLESIDFYPGSYDATWGRNASGIVDAKTRAGRTDAPVHGDVELKLYDASALVEGQYKDLTVIAAGRYGYPGPIIRLIQPGVDVSYWDYQLRADLRGLTLEALGSYDALSLSLGQLGGNGNGNGGGGPAQQYLVEFHRVQLRERLRRKQLELEAAIVGGLDRMAVFSGQGVQKLSLAGRVEARLKLGPVALAVGGDVELSRFRAEQFETDANRTAPDELGALADDRDGVVGGAYAQATLDLERWTKAPTSITAGVRADVYHAAGVTLVGVDPRLVFRYAPLRQLELFGGFGRETQAPSFPIPLPGIDTFALELGLQQAWQGSVGLRVKLPEELSISATGYYGRFDNINDVTIDPVPAACTSPPPESIRGLAAYVMRQVSGDAYGLELLVRKQRGRVTGWLSYTLSRAERVYSCGLAPSDFDQTHTLNLVVQLHLPWRLLAGGHVQLSTGRPYTQLTADIANATFSGDRNALRMPTYFQLDLRVDREWLYAKWAFILFVEALNVTYSESIYGVTYPKDPVLMIERYDQPQFAGFRWVIPSIGVRGRF